MHSRVGRERHKHSPIPIFVSRRVEVTSHVVVWVAKKPHMKGKGSGVFIGEIPSDIERLDVAFHLSIGDGWDTEDECLHFSGKEKNTAQRRIYSHQSCVHMKNSSFDSQAPIERRDP